jgi:hypothetical protein
MKSGFVLIPKRDAIFYYSTQLGDDAHEQQIHCNNMQPRFIHAFFAASAMPASFKLCR